MPTTITKAAPAIRRWRKIAASRSSKCTGWPPADGTGTAAAVSVPTGAGCCRSWASNMACACGLLGAGRDAAGTNRGDAQTGRGRDGRRGRVAEEPVEPGRTRAEPHDRGHRLVGPEAEQLANCQHPVAIGQELDRVRAGLD